MTRVTKSYAFEESFSIFKGPNTEGELVYTQPTPLQNDQVYTWIKCFKRTLHTILMLDSYGDGWTKDSNLVITAEGQVVGTYTLPKGRNATASIVLNEPQM